MKKLALALLVFSMGSIASAKDINGQVVRDYIHSQNQTIVNVADRCLFIMNDPGTADFRVMTVQNAFCGGDPQISSTLAFLTVVNEGGKSVVKWQDIVAGDAEAKTTVFTEDTPK